MQGGKLDERAQRLAGAAIVLLMMILSLGQKARAGFIAEKWNQVCERGHNLVCVNSECRESLGSAAEDIPGVLRDRK
jgi:hypothetical protein